MKYLQKLINGFIVCLMASSLYSEKLTIIWEKEFGDDPNLSYIAHEGVYTDGMLNLIGYSYESQKHATGTYWFWAVADSGDILVQDLLCAVSCGRPSTIGFGSWRTKGLKVDQGSLYCAGKFGTSDSSLAHYKMFNKMFNYNPIQPTPLKTFNDMEKGYVETILRMVNLSKNNFLLIGYDTNSKSFAKKTDVSGNALWHQVYGKGTISFLADALEIGNSLILLECYTDGDPVKKPYEGYQCRLIRCDSEGNILSEKTFAGGGAFPNKYPELRKIDASRYLVSYDMESLPNRANFSAAAYSDTLELLWQRTIYNGEVRVPMYGHVMPLTSGGFISVYSAMSHDEAAMNLKVHLYSETGEMSGSLTLQNYIAIDDFLLVGSEKTLYVVALSGPEDDTYRVKVKICAIAIE